MTLKLRFLALITAAVFSASAAQACVTLSHDIPSYKCNDSACQFLCVAPVRSLAAGQLVPGFFTVQRRSKLIVSAVARYSPAASAGVQPGDELRAIDGIDLPLWNENEQRWQIKARHIVQLVRDGTPVSVTLTPVPIGTLLATLRERGTVQVALREKAAAPEMHPFLTGLIVNQTKRGLIVSSVLRGSPAFEKGLRAGDTILVETRELREIEGGDSRATLHLVVRRPAGDRRIALQSASVTEILENVSSPANSPESLIAKRNF